MLARTVIGLALTAIALWFAGRWVWMLVRLGRAAQRPDLVTAACPYCVAMLADGVALRQRQGRAGAGVEVTDVAEVLLRSVRTPARAAPAHTEGGPQP